MNEQRLVSSLTDLLRVKLHHSLVTKHSERIVGGTVGVPDVSVNCNRDTSWWEVKYADPTFTSHGRQELTMLMLANYSHHARYIIYEKVGKVKRSYIVHPSNLAVWNTTFEHIFEGFNHEAIVNYIKKVHGIE